MFATLKRPILALALVAAAAMLCMSPAFTSSADAAGDDFKQFKKDWKDNSKDMDAMARQGIASKLPANNVEAVEHLATVLDDPFWSVRIPAVKTIIETKDPATVAAWVELLKNDKKKYDNIRESIAFGLSHRNGLDNDGWGLLRELVQNKAMPWNVREVFARSMSRWPAARPPQIDINDNKEEAAETQKKIDKINEFAQPILKANIMALHEVLKETLDDKIARKNKNDAAYRKLVWSTVYAMETISSQEFGDDLTAWELFLTQNHYDHEKKQLKDLTYRWREHIDTNIGNVKISGETAVRKKKRRDTNTDLIMIPQMGYGTDYFFPFMEEFTHYFDVSFFKVPMAEAGEPGAKMRDGTERTDAYMYPTAKVAKAFDDYQKKKGGDKNLGMFVHGDSCFIGMEFAKNNPDKAAFLIVVGGWGTNSEVTKGIQQCKDSKKLDLRYYGIINRTNYGPVPQYPEPFTDEKRFLGNAGEITYQFADPYDTDQYVISSIGRDKNPERIARSPLIDEEYAFTARPASKVPALFIWGDQDPMATRSSENYLKRYFPSAMFVTMKGVGRLPWIEDPIAFFDHIENFMDKKKVWKKMEDTIKKE